MQKHTFDIALDSGEFFQRCTDEAGKEYEIAAPFKAYDELANGFKWSMSVKHKGQRKYHAKSVVTASVYGLLDYVRAEFVGGASAQVMLQTTDVELNFFLA
jgi:hypothetical protein